MSLRNQTYKEALDLYDKLTFAGFPAQIWFSDNRWKVQVEQVSTNNNSRLDSL